MSSCSVWLGLSFEVHKAYLRGGQSNPGIQHSNVESQSFDTVCCSSGNEWTKCFYFLLS